MAGAIHGVVVLTCSLGIATALVDCGALCWSQGLRPIRSRIASNSANFDRDFYDGSFGIVYEVNLAGNAAAPNVYFRAIERTSGSSE